ncbi:MAG: hypothetical protein F6J93_30960 [Oscillatoria sp. SIO1A7]|nr:hypothetical protein [Oscillatoria sp. SIO1A7]
MIARSIEQIEKELVALKQSSLNLAEDLQKTYSSYLAALGQAARQQLIMASYHLCTQGYAESFLRLSLKERQDLQEGIRSLAKGTKEKLQDLLPDDLAAELSRISVEDSAKKMERSPIFFEEPNEEPNEASDEANEEASDEASDEANEEASDESDRIADSDNSSRETIAPDVAPDKLVQWQKKIENEIIEQLQIGSRYTNRLLKKFGILSKNLPEVFIEAAGKAPNAPDGVAGPPNILNVTLEIDNPEEESGSSRSKRKKSQQLRVVAIQLRLSEIELADSNVRARRNPIRSLASRLHSLERDYRQTQQEKAIAEAEAAWRASWIDE